MPRHPYALSDETRRLIERTRLAAAELREQATRSRRRVEEAKALLEKVQPYPF